MEAVIFVGIQAAGKSSFYFARFWRTHLRLNLDMLRTRRRESVLFEACLATRTKMVVDNTNATREERARFIAPARAARFTVADYYFASSVADCLRRNQQRDAAQCIPTAGVMATHNRLQLPHLDEGFDELFYVRMDEAKEEFIVEEWGV